MTKRRYVLEATVVYINAWKMEAETEWLPESGDRF